MSVLDIFNADPFSIVSMTKRINDLPFIPGQIGSMGVFAEEPIMTTTALIERDGFILGLVAPTPRGGPGETAPKDPRNMLAVPVPHYQRDDAVYADEVQGVRAFGTDNTAAEATLATIEQLIDRKMLKHTKAFDATLEHQRAGALAGLVVDKNGVTLFDIAAGFGVALPATLDWALGTATTSIRDKVLALRLAVEAALDGIPYSGIRVLAGTTFFTKLQGHPNVEKFFVNYPGAKDYIQTSIDKFEFGNLVFERYRTGAQATAALATPAPFVPDNGARIIIEGVPDLYMTFFAPADYIETVNTPGLPRYSKQFRMLNDKGITMELQTNAMSICTRPKALLSLTTSN